MINRDLAEQIAQDLCDGKKIVLIVGTRLIAEEYFARVRGLTKGRPTPGAITVLCSAENNGREWLRERFDVAPYVEVSAQEFPAWTDLVAQAGVRAPTEAVQAKPKMDRRLKQAIRGGRREPGATS